MKADDIMEYDYLKVKPYTARAEEEEDGTFYVLSFSDTHHVKVSQMAKKIIDLFNGKYTLDEIKNKLQEMDITLTDDELKKMTKEILWDKAILVGTEHKSKRGNMMLWLKIPIIESNKLKPIFNILQYLFNRKVLILGLILILFGAVISIYMMIVTEINQNEVNSIKIIVLGYLSLIMHEFGHVAAAHKCGINAGEIGFGMYMFTPVMYVDMTNAWRLESQKRVLVDFGGMYFQGLTAVVLTIIAFLSGDSTYYICTMSILAMTLYNLMPFIKLDGYWLFCDYFKLDNISINAFSLVKNTLLKGESKKWNKKKKVYSIFSFVYVISVVFMVCVGLYYSISVLINWSYIIETVQLIGFKIQNNYLADALSEINSILIYLIPLIFILVMIVKNIIRLLFKRRKND